MQTSYGYNNYWSIKESEANLEVYGLFQLSALVLRCIAKELDLGVWAK